MKKSICCVLSVAAVLGTALTSTAASAAVTATGPTEGTTVTFAITAGDLTVTVPDSADLNPGPPGTIITDDLGTVTVTDDRALLAASWTVTASSTDFTVGGATTPETIPVADVTYNPGTVSKTGTITTTPSAITLSHSAQTVVVGTAGIGNNTASWDPGIAIHVPAAAVNGTYTGTITHSVS
jgi:hypothetical protein